jgi:hypothetical protein
MDMWGSGMERGTRNTEYEVPIKSTYVVGLVAWIMLTGRIKAQMELMNEDASLSAVSV